MNYPCGDFRGEERIIRQASDLIRGTVGVPPAVRWRHDGTPRMMIESYLYVPAAPGFFPRLPMHMLGIQLDGKSARKAAAPADSLRKTPGQEQNISVTNRCVLVPRNTASHWLAPSGSVTMAAIYVTGPTQLTLESLTHGSQQPVFLRDPLLVALIRQLLRAATERGSDASSYVQRLTDAFTAQLEWLACVDRVDKERRSTLSDGVISKALGLIDEHLGEPISVEWLCEAVKVTPALFRPRFKDVTGMPVHRYILTQRAQRARELIQETNLALSVVATYCGFSSQSHMTTVYKREFGMTPGEQRRD